MSKKFIFLFALLILFVGTSNSSADLVGYWPLDGDGLDAGSNGLHGILVGDPVSIEDRDGNPDSALLFSGEADCYVDLEDEEQICFREKWKSKEDLDAHLRSGNFGVLIGATKLLNKEPEFSFDTISSSAGAEAVKAARG